MGCNFTEPIIVTIPKAFGHYQIDDPRDNQRLTDMNQWITEIAQHVCNNRDL